MISEWYRNSFLRFEGYFVYILCTDLSVMNMFVLLKLLEWLLKKDCFSVIGRDKRKAWLPISEKTMPKMHDPRTTICGDSTSWA